MDYLSSKNGLSSISALSKASNHYEQEPVEPKDKKLQATDLSLAHVSLVDRTNGTTHQSDVPKQTQA
jgi:hypothetical protein